MRSQLLLELVTLLLVGCWAAEEDEDVATVTGPGAPLRHAVVPVEPGTPVVYLVSLVGVPQGESALATNKVVPELAPQNSLTNLLLLASRNTLVDNPDLVMRDPSISNLQQGAQLNRNKRSPTFKKFGGGGGGCGGGCGGGYGGYGGYPGGGYGGYGGHGGYGGGGYGGYPAYGGGGGSCKTCGGGGYGGGGSYSQSSSQASSSASSYGKK